jgi:hypothetical protein
MPMLIGMIIGAYTGFINPIAVFALLSFAAESESAARWASKLKWVSLAVGALQILCLAVILAAVDLGGEQPRVALLAVTGALNVTAFFRARAFEKSRQT